MSDSPPPAHDLDLITASLRADAVDVTTFFHVLATKLADAMPGGVELEREGGFFKKDHPVKRIVVRSGDDIFEAKLHHAAVHARRAHAVRGITLRSEQLDFDAWLAALVQSLGEQARSSAAAGAALRSLVS